MNLGPPTNRAKLTDKLTEKWVLVDREKGLWRDANSHPDPAFQKRKCVPPLEAVVIPTWHP